METEKLLKRIAELESAIRKHRDNFSDESLDEEYELWAVLNEYSDEDEDEEPYNVGC